MKWVHVDIWFWNCTFRTDAYLSEKERRNFEKLLTEFITQCKPYIRRKFFLYEDIPHCFIALEVKKEKDIKRIGSFCSILKSPFIYKAYLNKADATDVDNGEGFLDVLNAMTEFYLFRKDNRITHIIHCCMEFMLPSRQAECKFYQNMAVMYQVKKIGTRKITYGLKKITPKIRTKLIKYIHSLDLRRR